jgi:hypothetical protein
LPNIISKKAFNNINIALISFHNNKRLIHTSKMKETKEAHSNIIKAIKYHNKAINLTKAEIIIEKVTIIHMDNHLKFHNKNNLQMLTLDFIIVVNDNNIMKMKMKMKIKLNKIII